MTGSASSSLQIARKARSNLAFALSCLPAERKRDMISFYAFCRIVDDIADEATVSEDAKEKELAQWKHAVLQAQLTGHPVLDEVVVLPAKYGFPRAWLAEIIDGVESDLSKLRYETFEELLGYCYKVASVVGLVSAEIFGHQKPITRDYAIQLGYALQMTNIIRDVGQDAREMGRIYLPLEDLRAFEVTETEILEGRHNQRFVRLMEFQWQRALEFYRKAEQLLPPEDRESMQAAEMMGHVYFKILIKLKKLNFPVFEQRVRLHSTQKAGILLSYLTRIWWRRALTSLGLRKK